MEYPKKEGKHGPIYQIADCLFVVYTPHGTWQLVLRRGALRKKKTFGKGEEERQRAIKAAELLAVRLDLTPERQPDTGRTFGMVAEEWLRLNAPRWQPGTKERYQSIVRDFLRPLHNLPSYNPRTGTYARGVTAYGPYGSRSYGEAYNPRTGTYGQTRQGSNVYGNWGTSTVQRGDNWAQTAHRENYRTGTSTGGIRTSEGGGAVTRTGPGGDRTTVGRTQGGDIYAGHDGNVYRRTEGGGWEQNNGSGGWTPADSGQAQQARDRAAACGATAGTTAAGTRDRAATTGGSQAGQLQRDSAARTGQRTTNRSGWQSSGATRSGAGNENS